MKLFIDNGDYKCIVEDSWSEELNKLWKETNFHSLPKCTVVTITIDSKHSEYPKQVKVIEKDIREVIRALKGIDYTEEMIISVKFEDLTKKNV